MVNYRLEKVRRVANDIPNVTVCGPESGKLLILGWGGTYGPIYQALSELESQGIRVSHAHLNYLNPFPRNLVEVLGRFEKILIPELNMGQLIVLLRNQFPGVNAVGLNKVQGQPFKVFEVVQKVKELL